MLKKGIQVLNSNIIILGFTFKGVVYMVFADRYMVDRFVCLDKASRGAGYSLRFKPTVEQKIALLMGAEVVCSVDYFNSMVVNSIYNRGEIFEKLVTEKLGQVWEKDDKTCDRRRFHLPQQRWIQRFRRMHLLL